MPAKHVKKQVKLASSASDSSFAAGNSSKRKFDDHVNGHNEGDRTLQLRVHKAVNRNRSLAKLTSKFTVPKKGGLLGHHEEKQCWAVLDPALGTLSLYDSDPEETKATDPSNIMSFFESAVNHWSHYASHSRRRPKMLGQTLMRSVTASLDDQTERMPFRSFDLASLRRRDFNPKFLSIFLYFNGADDVRLTAACEEEFGEWMRALNAYDVFVKSPALGAEKPTLKNMPCFRARSDLGKVVKPVTKPVM